MSLEPVQFKYLTAFNKDLLGFVASFVDGPDLINLSKSTMSLHKFIKDITNEKPEHKKRIYELRIVFDMKQVLLAISNHLRLGNTMNYLSGGNYSSFDDLFDDDQCQLQFRINSFCKKNKFLQKSRKLKDAEFEIFNHYNENHKQFSLVAFLKHIRIDFIDSPAFKNYIAFLQDYLSKNCASLLLKPVKPIDSDESKENETSLISQNFLEVFFQFARNKAWSYLYKRVLKMIDAALPTKSEAQRIDRHLIEASKPFKKDLQEMLNSILAQEGYKPIITFFNTDDRSIALARLFYTFGLDIIYSADEVFIEPEKPDSAPPSTKHCIIS